jgi:hypothetical protein
MIATTGWSFRVRPRICRCYADARYQRDRDKRDPHAGDERRRLIRVTLATKRRQETTMIARIWSGAVRRGDGDEYAAYDVAAERAV